MNEIKRLFKLKNEMPFKETKIKFVKLLEIFKNKHRSYFGLIDKMINEMLSKLDDEVRIILT